MKNHSERVHSKFSASGAERWFECPGSVELSEGLPDKSSPYAEEGTRAHEVLERVLKAYIEKDPARTIRLGVDMNFEGIPREMQRHVVSAADFIAKLHAAHPGSELLVESRVYLDFIHPEAFGTLDSAVVDHFGTLHVLDFKYGAGVGVSPRENLQMIFYMLALANKYHWNFKKVRAWIIQPRIRGYDGPVFWEISLLRLKGWAHLFRKAIERVEKEPETYVEGSHCHWCKAKSICPVKRADKLEKARMVFGD